MLCVAKAAHAHAQAQAGAALQACRAQSAADGTHWLFRNAAAHTLAGLC